jgi:hypothetical protein
MVETFRSYLNYMSGVQYMNDGNDILVKKGFVSLTNPADNEQPLYITKYDDKFGNFKYQQDPDLTYNEVAEINTQRASKMSVDSLGLVTMDDGNIIEINDFTNLMKEDDPTKYNHAKIISLIIKLLSQGKQVIYNPRSMPGYNKMYYETLLKDRTEKLRSIEFIFVPRFTEGATASYNYFFKPLIQTNQAMMFRPNEILIKFLMMFLSLDNLSSYLNNGSYELMSRIRIGYLINTELKITAKKPLVNAAASPMLGGGGGDINTDIDLYNEGLDILYKGGGRRHRRPLHVKRRSFKKMTRKIRRGLRNTMQKMRRGNKQFKSKKYIKKGGKKTHKR